jgi:hypothetical protein
MISAGAAGRASSFRPAPFAPWPLMPAAARGYHARKGPASALRVRAAGPGARMHAVGEHNRAEGPYRRRRDSQGRPLWPVEKVARPPIRNPRRPARAPRAALQEAFAP